MHPAPRAPLWVAVVAATFLAAQRLGAFEKVDADGARAYNGDMRPTAALIALTLAACGDDPDPTPTGTSGSTGQDRTTSTTSEPADGAGLEEICVGMWEPNSAWPPCRSDLVCLSPTLLEGGLQIAGHCVHRCTDSGGCLDAQVCIEGACVFECGNVACPYDWMYCDPDVVKDTAVCLGMGTF